MKVPAKVLCNQCRKVIVGDAYLEVTWPGDPRREGPALIRDNCILNTLGATHLCSRECVVEFLLLDYDVAGTPTGEDPRRLEPPR